MTKKLKFEEAIKRLENIVEKMENNEIELEKSLSLFEEGIGLVKFCSSKLEETKKKVEILTKKGSKLTPIPFDSKKELEEEE